MNILQANKFYLLVQVQYYKKLNLLTHHLEKAFEKQTKTIKDHANKQIEDFEKQGKKQLVILIFIPTKKKIYCS